MVKQKKVSLQYYNGKLYVDQLNFVFRSLATYKEKQNRTERHLYYIYKKLNKHYGDTLCFSIELQNPPQMQNKIFS